MFITNLRSLLEEPIMTRSIVGAVCLCIFLLLIIVTQEIYNSPFMPSAAIFGIADTVFNFIPILANNGMMPVKMKDGYAFTGKRHCSMTNETHCNWFADKFHWKDSTFSIGDIFLTLMLMSLGAHYIHRFVSFVSP